MKFIDMVTVSKRTFILFVDECNRTYRQGNDLKLYRDIIKLHKKHSSISLILEDDLFYTTIYDTLVAWNMNQRGARLTSRDLMRNSVMSLKDELIKLSDLKLKPGIQLEEEYTKIIKKIFLDLKVMESKRKIVGVSKTMHFIFPELIVPVDSTHTLSCFYNYNKYDNTSEKEFKTFMEIFQKCIDIVNKLNLTEGDVDGEKWNTSIPKLIDNAIIGFFRYIYSHDVSEVISLLKSS